VDQETFRIKANATTTTAISIAEFDIQTDGLPQFLIFYQYSTEIKSHSSAIIIKKKKRVIKNLDFVIMLLEVMVTNHP